MGLSFVGRQGSGGCQQTLGFNASELWIGALTSSNGAELGDELISAGSFQAANLLLIGVRDMLEVEGR
jgi:hypothetical protein